MSSVFALFKVFFKVLFQPAKYRLQSYEDSDGTLVVGATTDQAWERFKRRFFDA